MFDKEFFPTPKDVIYQMIYGLDLRGKIVLEPNAGKGDIIDILKEEGAKVLACELNEELALISANKADVFIKQDFFELSSDEISHANYIIMNPPFSNADEHILHALEIAPDGCEIIALANAETYYNPYSRKRKLLKAHISDLGSVKTLGNVFSTSERKTDANIILIKLFKPKSKCDDEFEGFLFTEEEEAQYMGGGDGLVKFSKIREIVGRYIQAVKMFDSVIEAAENINSVISPIGGSFKVQFDTLEQRGSIYSSISRDDFKSKLQKSAWLTIFREMKMDKYLTKSIMDKLNKEIETQITKPLTEKNIFGVIEVIIGTHEGRMKQVLIDIFDWLTERHSENRYHLEGWKTNSMYFVGEKFIAPYCGVSMGYSGNPEIRWSSHGQKIDELTKALCVLTGKNYDDFSTLEEFFTPKKVPNNEAQHAIALLSFFTELDQNKCTHIHSMFKYFAEHKKIGQENIWKLGRWGINQETIDKIIAFYQEKMYSEKCFGEKYEYKEWGKWYEWGFFKIKVYKKGTCHAIFRDKKVWEMFNKEAAKAKGWALPTNTGSDVRRKGNGVEIYN